MAINRFPEHSFIMPPTLNKTHECQIIRKIFSNRENADKAIEAFKDLKISAQDIGIVVRFDDDQIKDREYQEYHDSVRSWLAGWANLETSPVGRATDDLLVRTGPSS